MSALRKHYGDTPLHLLAHLAALALVGFILLQLIDTRAVGNIALWFLGAVILHDFLLLPFYSGIDRLGARIGPAVNYLKVPLALSALMLLVYFPLILRRSTGNLDGVSGAPHDGYLGRWLLVSAALFVVSAVLYVLRGRRAAPVST